MTAVPSDNPNEIREHWERVYASKEATAVSWFQATPVTSLALIRACGAGPSTKIIDVGGGASTLADHLLAEGFNDLTVLDLSAKAIEQLQQRLGPSADRVHWVTADITRWQPEATYDLWHDRAVFHFLTDPADRNAYRTALTGALQPGASAIMATFAPDGPERCSGLPVCRYSPEALAAELGPGLTLVESRTDEHRTPTGALQRFVFCRFTR